MRGEGGGAQINTKSSSIVNAYMRLYLWFAGTTGVALTEKTRLVMHPTAPKHDHEIADALEKWADQERTIRAHGDNYTLNAAFKTTALRVLMSCKREQFDNMERESKSKHGDKMCDAMFDDLFSNVKEYVHQRRLGESHRKSKGDPMDVSQLQQSAWQDNSAWSCSDAWHNEQDVDALGKGKSSIKGKGNMKGRAKGSIRGPCYNCGENGHLAFECQSAKSKGKGKAPPICWSCGVSGHVWWNCSSNQLSAQSYNAEGKGLAAKGKGAVLVLRPFWRRLFSGKNERSRVRGYTWFLLLASSALVGVVYVARTGRSFGIRESRGAQQPSLIVRGPWPWSPPGWFSIRLEQEDVHCMPSATASHFRSTGSTQKNPTIQLFACFGILWDALGAQTLP